MNSKNILLVEDNESDALVAKKALEKADCGYNCIHVVSFSDADKVLQKEHIDVILLDLFLPDSRGEKTFLNMYKKYPKIPILVLTACEDETMAFDALGEGILNYLMKDKMKSQLLVEAIENTISKFNLLKDL